MSVYAKRLGVFIDTFFKEVCFFPLEEDGGHPRERVGHITIHFRLLEGNQ
jgi:hypothetical protein